MTYDESAALMIDLEFRGRIKVAVLKFADSIIGESTTVPAHNTRAKWAQAAMQQPDQTAMQIQPAVVMDSQVQTDGKDITDVALQGSVEATVNKMM